MIADKENKSLMEIEGAIIIYKAAIPVNEFFQGLCETLKKVLIAQQEDILVSSYDHTTSSD